MKSPIIAFFCIVTLCLLNSFAFADEAYWENEDTPSSKITEKDFDVNVHDAPIQDKLTNRGVYDDGSLPELDEPRPPVIPGLKRVEELSTQRNDRSYNREPSSLRLRRLRERNRSIERPVSINKKPEKPGQDALSTQKGASEQTTGSGKSVLETTKDKPKQVTTPPGPQKGQKENTAPTNPGQDDTTNPNRLKWGKVELQPKDNKNKLQWGK
jgi:hypothetical protein